MFIEYLSIDVCLWKNIIYKQEKREKRTIFTRNVPPFNVCGIFLGTFRKCLWQTSSDICRNLHLISVEYLHLMFIEQMSDIYKKYEIVPWS